MTAHVAVIWPITHPKANGCRGAQMHVLNSRCRHRVMPTSCTAAPTCRHLQTGSHPCRGACLACRSPHRRCHRPPCACPCHEAILHQTVPHPTDDESMQQTQCLLRATARRKDTATMSARLKLCSPAPQTQRRQCTGTCPSHERCPADSCLWTQCRQETPGCHARRTVRAATAFSTRAAGLRSQSCQHSN